MTRIPNPAPRKREDSEPCKHEWILFHVYDAAVHKEKHYLECRKCQSNAGENASTRIHGSRYVNIVYPVLNMDWNHKQPSAFIGTGMNTWYPVND